MECIQSGIVRKHVLASSFGGLCSLENWAKTAGFFCLFRLPSLWFTWPKKTTGRLVRKWMASDLEFA